MDSHSVFIDPAEQYAPRVAHSPVCPGIVIVDTSSLFNLGAPVPEEWHLVAPEDPADRVRLWQTLICLAEAGYAIIFPEMVAFEIAGVLRDGRSIQMHFLYSQPKPMQTEFIEFITKYKNLIHIVPPCHGDANPAAQYINQAYAIHIDDSSNRVYMISELNKRFCRKNFGDMAAQAIVQFMDNKNIPVFYLADDIVATHRMHEVRRDIKVTAVTTPVLLQAFYEKNLFPMMNVASAPFDIWDGILKDHSAACGFEVRGFEHSPYSTHQNTDAFIASFPKKLLLTNRSSFNPAPAFYSGLDPKSALRL